MGRRLPFTTTQKRDAVLAVVSGKQTVSEVCRELGISAQTFARWRSSALAGMEDALADKDDRSRREAELERKLDDAESTIDYDRAAMKRPGFRRGSRVPWVSRGQLA